MPWINKPQKEFKEKKNAEYTEHKLLRRKAYNSAAWQKVRLTYLKEHPLCDECLKKGKVVAATSIHHLRSPFNYEEGTINQYLLLDSNNLESVCHECHQKLHNGEKKPTPEELLSAFEELLKDIE